MLTRNGLFYGYRLAVQTAGARNIMERTLNSVGSIVSPNANNENLFRNAMEKQAQKLANEAKPVVGIPFDPKELNAPRKPNPFG